MRIFALALALIVGGCDTPSKKADAARDIASDAQIRAMAAQDEISNLKLENKRLESELKTVRDLAILTSESLESLRKTFNGNVEINNENNRQARTDAGLCGRETVYLEGGGYTVRNKECPKIK